MRTFIPVLPVLFLFVTASLADEIILKDGTRLYGEVRKEGDHIVVVDSRGKSVVLKEEVNEIKTVDRLKEEYKYILERNETSPPHFQLGCWCWKRGLVEEAFEHFRRVLEKDPENAGARWAMGQFKVRGIWVDAGVWAKLPGKKKTWVRWFPEGKKGRLQVRMGEEPDDARDLVRDACRGPVEDRKAAEKALEGLSDARRRESFQLALLDRNSRVRRYAIRMLQESAGLEVAKGMLKSALYDPVRDVRKAALQALVEGPYPMARDLVIEGLTSKHFPVRLNAINGLGSFPARETVEALCSIVESSAQYGGSPRVNLFVGRQFGYVRDFDVEVAAWSAIGDPIVATQMEGVVLDVRVMHVVERQGVVSRSAAFRSLCRIAGKDLGRDVEVWRKWAKEKFGS